MINSETEAATRSTRIEQRQVLGEANPTGALRTKPQARFDLAA